MQISRYFTLTEATYSDTAARLGIANQPDAAQLENIRQAAARLDAVRERIGAPIVVSSWFRAPELNRAIPGASPTSAHTSGWAIDCHVAGLSALDLCKSAARFLIARGIAFDQIIHEYGHWMHLSFEPRGRGQLLTIFSGVGYAQGLLTEQEARHA
ncbi:MAG: peptidase M15 [Burkholderiaceae bacterium]|jgi:hypothetical protein|nr:peptidase M15 [Burkholderiaceae bacterium]